MVTGVKCLMFSAEQVDLEDESGAEMSKFEKWLDDKLGDKVKDIAIYFSVIVAMCFSVGLFMLLPTAIAGLFKYWIKNSVALNLIEGLIKMIILTTFIPSLTLIFVRCKFLTYMIFLCSKELL